MCIRSRGEGGKDPTPVSVQKVRVGVRGKARGTGAAVLLMWSVLRCWHAPHALAHTFALVQEHQHMTAQLQVPTAQQFFSADPAHRTLMLQQMQQSMVQQQPPMQYMQAPPYGLMPGAVPVQVGPSAAAPMQPMQPPPPPGPPPPQKQRGGRREKAPAPPEATHNTANNPFDQAQGASAPSYYGGASEKQAKVQQLDQELEALRARLAEKQGDPGLWVPGKGYSNPPDAGGKGSKGGKGGKGQGKGGKGDAGHADQKQGPYVAAVFHTYGDDAADDNDEDWETAESWDASGY